MHSICCMDLLLENCYTRSFMRMPKRIHGACTFSSYVHLEVSFTSHGALTATCFSSPETAEFRNKGLISSRLTENGTGTCSSEYSPPFSWSLTWVSPYHDSGIYFIFLITHFLQGQLHTSSSSHCFSGLLHLSIPC